MELAAMFIAGLLILPAVALVSWAWLVMDQVEAELLTSSGYEGMHFEI